MISLARLGRAFRLKRLTRDERGVSAIEFALIAPIIIATYLGMGELTLGMMATRKSSHLAATVGDLVSQSESISSANLNDIYEIGASIMEPFPSGTDLTIRVSNVTMGADEKARVTWSDGHYVSPYAVNTIIGSVGLDQIAVGESLVVTDVTYHYTSPVGDLLPGVSVFNQTYFHHPRNGVAVVKT